MRAMRAGPCAKRCGTRLAEAAGMDSPFALVPALWVFCCAQTGCSGPNASPIVPSGAPSADVVSPPPGVADRGDDPAVVAIDAADAPLCAGALVASDIVLTSRHCVSVPAQRSGCSGADAAAPPPLRAAESLGVRVGEDMIVAPERARGRGIIVPVAASMCGADIALLLLDVPIDDVQPLVVRATGAAQGDHLRSVGWRLPALPGVQGGEAPLGSTSAAPKILREHLLVVGASSTELELAEVPASGSGPALSEATAEVLGVFSRTGDGPSRAVYTRTDAFMALIERALAESQSAGLVSTGLRKAKKGPVDVGAYCAQGADCAAGVCVSTSAGLEQYCSRSCGSHDRCPAGYRCQKSQGGMQVCTET
jgi:hypothetical protein